MCDDMTVEVVNNFAILSSKSKNIMTINDFGGSNARFKKHQRNHLAGDLALLIEKFEENIDNIDDDNISYQTGFKK